MPNRKLRRTMYLLGPMTLVINNPSFLINALDQLCMSLQFQRNTTLDYTPSLHLSGGNQT